MFGFLVSGLESKFLSSKNFGEINVGLFPRSKRILAGLGQVVVQIVLADSQHAADPVHFEHARIDSEPDPLRTCPQLGGDFRDS